MSVLRFAARYLDGLMWYCWLLVRLDIKGLEADELELGGVAASLYSLRVLVYKSSRLGSINTESASSFLDFCLEGTLENVGS